MRPALLLTGPPAAGKSTTAAALVRSARLAAMIDVDDIRQLVVAGHAAPWDGEAGREQQRIGVENACDLALRFVGAGIEVVLADVVTAATAELYRTRIPDLRIVGLSLTLAEARRRAHLRPVHLTDAEFEALHAEDAVRTFAPDAVLDVTDLDAAEQTVRVAALWSAAAARETEAEVPGPDRITGS